MSVRAVCHDLGIHGETATREVGEDSTSVGQCAHTIEREQIIHLLLGEEGDQPLSQHAALAHEVEDAVLHVTEVGGDVLVCLPRLCPRLLRPYDVRLRSACACIGTILVYKTP